MLFDNKNPYKTYRTLCGGLTLYYVAFHDGRATQNIEISRAVYLEFRRMKKRERNLRRSDERNTEQQPLSENEIYNRATLRPVETEDSIIARLDCETLADATASLSEKQRKRLVLYFFERRTYAEIAEMEGCVQQAVAKSIGAAIKNIKKYFGQG